MNYVVRFPDLHFQTSRETHCKAGELLFAFRLFLTHLRTVVEAIIHKKLDEVNKVTKFVEIYNYANIDQKVWQTHYYIEF